MTGNVALDIAIGLVFIYTLYSLLTTTIVEFIASNLQLRSSNLKHAIRRMLDDDDRKVFSEKFIKAPGIKYLASKNFHLFRWINSFPSYMEASSFSSMLIYILKEEVQNDRPLAERIKEALQNKKNTETGKHLIFLLEQAHNDIEVFTQSIENWFNVTMERASGWYKKNITYITFTCAFIMAMIFNIDTFQMIRELSKNPEVRQQYVQSAGEIIKSPVFTNPTTYFDTTLRTRLKNDSNLKNKVTPEKFENFVNDSVSKALFKNQQELVVQMDTIFSLSQKAQNIMSFKRKKCPRWFFDSWGNFLGCWVTAIALTLGAPFWFDLLSKLMKLRSSIPVATTAEVTTKKTTTEEKNKIPVG